ncbi:MAG: hypothetical protein ACO1TE_04455 [Prosthecobacter sp.]
MPVKSAFLHLTRVWLSGGRWVVMLIALGALAWAYATNFWQMLPLRAELARPHPMEVSHLEMAGLARNDLKLDFSRGVSEPLNNWLPHTTDGLVRPLWPWLAAWLMDDTEGNVGRAGWSPRFATRVHLAKLSATLAVLVLLGLACARAFSVPAALLTVLLIGFGVFLPSGRFFLPDLLFSVLFLLTWVGCIAALKRNSLWLYGAIGFFSALANLTAPSATSLVIVFVGVSTLRWLWGWMLEQLSGVGTSLWVRRNHWLGLMLLVVCHLFTVGPMLSFGHQKLGDATPFHWRWFDSAEEMRVWTSAHHTRASLKAVSPTGLPSFENYRTSHSTEEIRSRLHKGTLAVAGTVLPREWGSVFPRGIFVAALMGILLLLVFMLGFATPRAHHAGQALHPETAPIVFFTLLALAVCSLDFGWDVPVMDFGNRVLALYPPLVLSLVWACEALVQRGRRRKMRLPVLLIYETVLWLLVGLGVWWMIAFLQPASITA